MKNNFYIASFALSFSLLLVYVNQAEAGWKINQQGQLINSAAGQVLGNHNNRQSGPPDNVPGAQRGSSNQRASQESETNDSTSDRPASIDFSSPGLRNQPKQTGRSSLQLRTKQDSLVIRSSDESQLIGDESEDTQETDVLEVEEHISKRNVRIRAKDNAAIVIRDGIASRSNFPLMVNTETNELIVTTPAGQRIVAVLPDQAVKNMLAANVLDHIGGIGGIRWQDSLTPPDDATDSADLNLPGDATDSADIDDEDKEDETEVPEEEIDEGSDATQSAELEEDLQPEETTDTFEEVDTVIELTTTDDGHLVYEITGSKSKRLLGFHKVTVERTAIVSAQTGALLELRQDWRNRILDILSL